MRNSDFRSFYKILVPNYSNERKFHMRRVYLNPKKLFLEFWILNSAKEKNT